MMEQQLSTPLLVANENNNTNNNNNDDGRNHGTDNNILGGDGDDLQPLLPPDDSVHVEMTLHDFKLWIATQQRRAMIFSCILSLICIVVVLVWIHELGGLAWNTQQHVFNWHPVMMVVAFLFMTVASLSFRFTVTPTSTPSSSTTTWTQQQQQQRRRQQRKIVHAVSWTVALLCMLVGLIAVFRSHNNGPTTFIANLYSFHSWIGIGVFLLYVIQFTSAVLVFGGGIVSTTTTTTTPLFKAKLLVIHYYIGPTIYVGMFITMLLGIQEKEGFISCAYKVDHPDVFPPIHFDQIPTVCIQSHVLGILIALVGISTMFALSGERPGNV